jgi:hypothetical protein
MIEQLGEDIVVNGDVLPGADYYEGIDDTPDGIKIDKIISNIDQKDPNDTHDVHAFAQGVLFLLDKDTSSASVRSSIAEHPSAQNVTVEKISSLADEIIHAFQIQVKDLERYKKKIDLTAARRDACFVVIRNLEQLDEHDRERIAETLGYSKDHFKSKLKIEPETKKYREPDFRERQFKS